MGSFYHSAAITAFDEAAQAFVLVRDMKTLAFAFVLAPLFFKLLTWFRHLYAQTSFSGSIIWAF